MESYDEQKEGHVPDNEPDSFAELVSKNHKEAKCKQQNIYYVNILQILTKNMSEIKKGNVDSEDAEKKRMTSWNNNKIQKIIFFCVFKKMF